MCCVRDAAVPERDIVRPETMIISEHGVYLPSRRFAVFLNEQSRNSMSFGLRVPEFWIWTLQNASMLLIFATVILSTVPSKNCSHQHADPVRR